VRRAFGLKGELVVQPSTNEPGAVFAPGSRLYADYADPTTTASRGYSARGEYIVQASRPFKDSWLVKLEGVADKTEADKWRGVTFEVPVEELSPPDDEENEVYLHELTGMRVRDEQHGELGVVAGWYELPQGLVLEVRGAAWRADVPFNEAFVENVDRKARMIDLRLPEGLVEAVVAPGEAAPAERKKR
jgi:16S rRNA processing protein RimM